MVKYDPRTAAYMLAATDELADAAWHNVDEQTVYAIQHPDGWLVRKGANRRIMRFHSAASAKAHIDTLPCNGYSVVRYS
jgi:hypothetical protein